MIEKFLSTKHADLAASLPFSYFTTPLYLDAFTFLFKRNEETIFAWQEDDYPHNFPSMFLPKNEKNWERARVFFATNEEIEKIKKAGIPIEKQFFQEKEYFYNTKSFVSASGPLTKRVNKFAKTYPTHTVLHAYPQKAVLDFYEAWKGTKKRSTPEEGSDFFLFCLKNLEKYDIRQVYVEIGGKLVGLAWGVQLSPKHWVGLHLKVDYEIDGLSRFLHLQRAMLFKDTEEFSLGTGCGDPGIQQFKEELKPIRTVEYHYLLTKINRRRNEKGRSGSVPADQL